MTVMMSAIPIEDLCRMRPSVTEVMAEIFSEWKFSFGGEEMLAAEVFAGGGFLPVLSTLACHQGQTVFGLPMVVDTNDDDKALFGFEVEPGFSSPSAMMLYLLSLLQVSYEVFGNIPSQVLLDDLYEWAMDGEKQKKERVPYLGVTK